MSECTSWTVRSIADPDNRRYVVSASSQFDSIAAWYHAFLSPYIGYYETMGDGETQHTPLHQAPSTMFLDFCASVADYLLTGPPSQTADLARTINSELWYTLPHAKMRHALKVKYRDDKTAYYHTDTLKMSSASSKRDDRRWEQVNPWMDGTFKSAATLCGCFKGCFLHAYAKLSLARDVYYDCTERTAPDVMAKGLLDSLGSDWRDCNNARAAFYALREAAHSVACLDSAKRSLDCWRSNMANESRNREYDATIAADGLADGGEAYTDAELAAS